MSESFRRVKRGVPREETILNMTPQIRMPLFNTGSTVSTVARAFNDIVLSPDEVGSTRFHPTPSDVPSGSVIGLYQTPLAEHGSQTSNEGRSHTVFEMDEVRDMYASQVKESTMDEVEAST